MRSQVQITNFRKALDFCNLKRISYVGYKYTWDNRQEGAANTKVLDRVYLNSLGFTKFVNVKVKHVLNLVFDHLCLLVTLNGLQSFQGRIKKGHSILKWLKQRRKIMRRPS